MIDVIILNVYVFDFGKNLLGPTNTIMCYSKHSTDIRDVFSKNALVAVLPYLFILSYIWIWKTVLGFYVYNGTEHLVARIIKKFKDP